MKTIKVKSIFLFVCIVLFCILPAFSSCAEGKEDNFYADSRTQDSIYEMIQESEHYHTGTMHHMSLINGIIVKESITPIYYVSFFDYVETGELKIQSIFDEYGTDYSSRHYYAKIVNEKGEYIGKVILSLDEGDYYIGMSSIEPSKIVENVSGEFQRFYYQASFSYADHAERIKTLLGSDEFISVQDVKLVRIEYVGTYFFVEYEGETKVIPVGHTDANEELETNFEHLVRNDGKEKLIDANAVLSIPDLERHLDEHVIRYKRLLEENSAENDTDFEKRKYVRESAQTMICEVSPVNNIINIYDYLGMGK